YLSRLDLHAVRNLETTRLQLHDGVVLVTGDNGSGKTSLLEAIWLLGTGRSFRSARIAPMIRYGVDSLTVYGEVRAADGRCRGLGITRQRAGDMAIRIDGERVRSASVLAEALPVQLMHPESVEIVSGSPGRRRQFIDWGVFHVEHAFIEDWKAFRRSLEQRNALLRTAGASEQEFESWELRLAEAATAVDGHRGRYVAALQDALEQSLDDLAGPDAVQIGYLPGWDREQSLSELLRRQRQADREAGYTRVGPQRAELRLVAAGRRAAEVLSRGQQKVLACALLVAQDRLLAEARGSAGVILVDDLPAELDAEHRQRLGAALGALDAQVIMTAVQADLVLDGLEAVRQLDMFHVEQGRIVPR
ncbi:MAG: DNA replication/repair protein RecF, partial [Pseudomonadales bacterium]|nr:DNA replication/repair protein RecF [Pseudomonadales bacterium]